MLYICICSPRCEFCIYLSSHVNTSMHNRSSPAVKADIDALRKSLNVATSYRSIKNKALMYLAMLKDEAVTADVLKRFRGATNMTDKIAMLATLADTPGGAGT
jgi:Domain of unknown function (DUF3458_C) ARM repeats